METVLILKTRREFCSYACQSAALVAAGMLSACSGGPTAPSESTNLASVSGVVTARSIAVTVDAASPLAAVGSAATVQTALGTFLLFRTAQDVFTALTAVCTHEGCAITGFGGNQFVCPCHGSRFTTTGSVANGPATAPLQGFPTQFVNGVLTFAV